MALLANVTHVNNVSLEQTTQMINSSLGNQDSVIDLRSIILGPHFRVNKNGTCKKLVAAQYYTEIIGFYRYFRSPATETRQHSNILPFTLEVRFYSMT